MNVQASSHVGQPGDESLLDNNQIVMLRSLRNGAVLPKLIRTYLDQLPQQLHDLRTAVEQGDISTVSTLAHTLKSASYSIGAKQVGAACTELEIAARNGDLSKGLSWLLRLNEAAEHTRPCLEQYL